MTAYTSTKNYGPPTSGQFAVGDTYTDLAGVKYYCYLAGIPGSWVVMQVPTPVENTQGAGAATASVTAVERGDGNIHKTILTLAAKTITLTDEAGAGQYGGVKLYDFPEGNIVILGAVIDLDVTLLAPFIDTAAGDVGLGTTAVTNADALATTEQDIVPTTAIAALVAKAGPVTGVSTAGATFDGSATPVDLYLNMRIDDNAAHDTTAGNLLSGTVTVIWMNAGDI